MGGGFRNEAEAGSSTIAGGYSNEIWSSGTNSAIPGGRGLTLTGSGSFGFLGGNTGVNNMTISDANVSAFGNTNLWLANNNNTASELRFYEAYNTSGAFPNGTNYTAFKAGTQSTDITYTLPTALPTTAGKPLTSSTGGAMSWANELSLSNNNAITPTMELQNTNATGIGLEVTDGRVVLSYQSGAPATIPSNVVVFDVDDGTAASTPTLALPATATNGQILYVHISDPDGATVGAIARGTGDRLTYIHTNGAWVLFHVN